MDCEIYKHMSNITTESLSRNTKLLSKWCWSPGTSTRKSFQLYEFCDYNCKSLRYRIDNLCYFSTWDKAELSFQFTLNAHTQTIFCNSFIQEIIPQKQHLVCQCILTFPHFSIWLFWGLNQSSLAPKFSQQDRIWSSNKVQVSALQTMYSMSSLYLNIMFKVLFLKCGLFQCYLC